MRDTSARVLDEAQTLPVWEFMADATPEKIGYVMACYIDSLIQKGMTTGDAAFEAMNVTMEAIASAASDVTGESPLRAGALAIPDTTGRSSTTSSTATTRTALGTPCCSRILTMRAISPLRRSRATSRTSGS